MAENNFIDLLRNSTLARDFSKQPAVLDTSVYTNLKSYSITKSIPNTKLCFSRLVAPIQRRIFNMDSNITHCANIQECVNTNTRPNRVLQPVSLPTPTFRPNKVYSPKCCTFRNGQVTRDCICSNKVCKYGTNYCGSTKK